MVDYNYSGLEAAEEEYVAKAEPEKDVKKIVMGVIGSDVHAVGNTIMENFFVNNEDPIVPVNLGVQVPQKEFVDAAYETGAEAVWVSSLYGHAEMDCRGLKEKFVESGLDDVLLYVGGNLTIGSDKGYAETVGMYEEMGFDRVYPQNMPDTEPSDIIYEAYGDLKRDLGL